MKITPKQMTLGLLVGMVLCASSAWASFSVDPIGDPLEIGSWGQVFGFSGSATQIDAYLTSGVGVNFEAPGLRSFSLTGPPAVPVPAVGWNSTFTGSTLAIAQGPGTTLLYLTVAFTSDKSTPLSLDFFGWGPLGQVIGSQGYDWNGEHWTRQSVTTETSGPAVPEPSTYIAGALLLLPFGAQAVRRFRSRNA